MCDSDIPNGLIELIDSCEVMPYPTSGMQCYRHLLEDELNNRFSCGGIQCEVCMCGRGNYEELRELLNPNKLSIAEMIKKRKVTLTIK